MGNYVICDRSPKYSNNLSFAGSVTFKIGWSYFKESDGKIRTFYTLASISDGLTLMYETKEKLLKKLNRGTQKGGSFRMIEKSTLLAIIDRFSTNNCFTDEPSETEIKLMKLKKCMETAGFSIGDINKIKEHLKGGTNGTEKTYKGIRNPNG